MVLFAPITALTDTLRTRRDAMAPWIRYTIGLGVHAGSFAGLLMYTYSARHGVSISILIGVVVAFSSMAVFMALFSVNSVNQQLPWRTEIAALITACSITGVLIWYRPVFAPWIQSLPDVLGAPITMYVAWGVNIAALLPVVALTEWSAYR